jgi:hypothetical protein
MALWTMFVLAPTNHLKKGFSAVVEDLRPGLVPVDQLLGPILPEADEVRVGGAGQGVPVLDVGLLEDAGRWLVPLVV